MEGDEKWKNAEQAFQKRGHKAKLILNTERYTGIDWRQASGSGEYYVNYIVDKKRGSLVISGDLGDCIATWYHPLTVKDLAVYVRDVGYFVGKFQCYSDKYWFRDEDVFADIKQELKDMDVDMSTEKFQDDWDNFQCDAADDIDEAQGFFPHEESKDFLDRYLGDDWQEDADFWGRRISPRVYLWAIGLNMAVRQLGGQLDENNAK